MASLPEDESLLKSLCEMHRNSPDGASPEESLNQQPAIDPESKSSKPGVCSCYMYNRCASKSQPLSTSSESLEDSIPAIYRSASFSNFFNSPRSSSTIYTRNPIIYLTFSDESKRHTLEMCSLCTELSDSLEYSVKIDSYKALRRAGELNIHSWRDTNYKRAKWILFCISPQYKNALKAGEDNRPVVEIKEQEQGIIYIHNIARAEFLQNGSKNHRMIPVLFTKTKASTDDIPEFLRSSAFFWFPDQKEDLYQFLSTHRNDSL
ncbi:uncharacterized protein LOC134276124 [Saccostrea cucullata]|uniref:uncharacterized protein LOC134276124 n=1 Tax=Saccostrea cuccullata TaxID=36930 RepID=UPI002ED30127